MSQNIIDTGQAANDGTGEPLRQAFTAVNNNFSQIWSSGPVNSNVQITNNRILTLQTNQNLVLAPNGIGDVQANTNIVPDIDHVRDLGNVTNRWDSVWAYYVETEALVINNNLTVGGNLVVDGDIIEMGNIVTDTLTIQLANTALTSTDANGAGITVGANDNIATLLYNSTGNVWTTNIGISSAGNITAPYLIGDGSQITHINSGAIDFGNLTANISTTGNVSSDYGIFSGGNTVINSEISTTGDVVANAFIGDGSQLSNITGANIVGNISITGNVSSEYGIFSGGNTVINSEISTTGDVIANAFAGDGSQVSNVDATSLNGTVGSIPAIPDTLVLRDENGNVVANNLSANAIVGNGNLYVYPDAADLSGRLDIFLTAGPDIHVAGVGENLILGRDDTANVTIGVDGNVYVQADAGSAYTWSFGSDGNLTLPGGYTMGEPGGPSLRIQAPDTSDTIQLYWADQVSLVLGNTGSANIAQINTAGGSWTFDQDGALNVPNNGVIRQDGPVDIVATNYAQLQWVDSGNINIPDPNASGGPKNWAYVEQGGFYIETNINVGDTQSWSFGLDGNLTLASEGNIVGPTPYNSGHLQWQGNSSGDGGGYTTLRLVPDDTRESADSYLIIDPTGPSHIHIRAGGTQDNSGSELYLGGENSYFKVGAGANPPNEIASNGYTWQFATNGDLNLPGGTAYIGASTDFVAIDSNTQSGLNGIYIATNDISSVYNQGIVSVITDYGNTSKTWTFGTDGNLSAPGLISAAGNIETSTGFVKGAAVDSAGYVQGFNFYVNGALNVYGETDASNIIPRLNNYYDLGNTTNVWNRLYANNITVTSNVSGGNIVTDGIVSAESDVIGANLTTVGNVSGSNVVASANVTGSNVIVTSLGHEQIAISNNGQLVGGIDLLWDFANARLWTTGVESNGTIRTSGVVSAGGNITGGNINTDGIVSAAANVVAGNLISGGFVSALGNIILNSSWINDLADPFAPQDAATKNYVDTVAQGLHIHNAAYLASTTDLATYTGATVTYSQPNGYGNGVNATLSLTGNTLTDLDGVTLVGASSDTRLLIKNEANAVYNGIYTYTSDSVLTRSTDADVSGDLNGGDFIFVQAGNTQADTGWAQTTENVVIGTSNVVFAQFSGAGTYQAGNGLTLTGAVFSVNTDNDTTQILSGNVVVKNVPVANVTGLDSLLASYSGDISTTGNITGAKIYSNSDITATGNIVSLSNVIGAGASFTGNVDLNNYWINNVADPVQNQDAATKYYVDTSIANSTQMVQSDTPPASPAANTLWWDTVSGRLYVYYDDSISANWIDASPAAVQLTYAAGNNLTLTNYTFSLANNISVSGNVTANAFIGDGSQLTGTLSPYMGAAQISPNVPLGSTVTVPATSSNVNITNDTIYVTNTFTNGIAVVYNANGGTVMGGLGDGRIYYIGNATGTSFQLYDNAKNALLGGSAGRKNISGLGNSAQTFSSSALNVIVNYDSTTGNTVFVQSATANTVTTITGDFDVNLNSGQALRVKLFITGSTIDVDFNATSVNGNPVTGFILNNGIKKNITNNVNVTIVNFGGTYTIYNG